MELISLHTWRRTFAILDEMSLIDRAKGDLTGQAKGVVAPLRYRIRP